MTSGIKHREKWQGFVKKKIKKELLYSNAETVITSPKVLHNVFSKLATEQCCAYFK